MISKFFVGLAVFAAATANQQYITIYEDQNQVGSNLTIENKMPDLTEYREFLNNASSYCAVGWWVGYTNPDFNVEGGIGFLLDQTDENPRCENRIFSNFKSLRYLGNQNSDIPSISLYSKLNYHGYEAVVDPKGDGTALAKLPFVPQSYVTSGMSNWTFYGGENFSGSSWCVRSTEKVHLVHEINSAWQVVQSVAPGCNDTLTV